MQKAMVKFDFSNIYSGQKENVWRLVSRYVFSVQDREDLFQEVFLKIHKALPKFRGDSDIKTWIYKITSTTAINFLKKKKRYYLFKDLLKTIRIIEEEEMPDDEKPVFKPLEKLNPRQRMVVLLSDVEEEPLSQIAELLSIPLGTVKSVLHRAREIIKKELKKNG